MDFVDICSRHLEGITRLFRGIIGDFGGDWWGSRHLLNKNGTDTAMALHWGRVCGVLFAPPCVSFKEHSKSAPCKNHWGSSMPEVFIGWHTRVYPDLRQRVIMVLVGSPKHSSTNKGEKPRIVDTKKIKNHQKQKNLIKTKHKKHPAKKLKKTFPFCSKTAFFYPKSLEASCRSPSPTRVIASPTGFAAWISGAKLHSGGSTKRI